MDGFKKEERLCSRTLILRLIDKGSSFLLYPYRITSFETVLPSTGFPAQVLITVSRRRFKRAVDRNRVKRVIREAYRKNKSEYLYKHLHQTGNSLALMISYVGKEILPSPEMEKKLILVLERLQREYDRKGA
ncbi:MAG TPA: ribonuclease P protein component [Anseongella sp.]